MDEVKNLQKSKNVLQLSNALQKLIQSIERKLKDEKVKEIGHKEVEFLKEQCLSKNHQLSLLACQSLFRLVETGILLPANVLTMFMGMMTIARYKNIEIVMIIFHLSKMVAVRQQSAKASSICCCWI